MSYDVPPDIAASPTKGTFRAVSSLVKLPDLLPELGQLSVDPATLPAEPLLAYDHDGTLVSTMLLVATSITSMSTSMPVIRVSKNRMSMWCCGMSRRQMKPESANNTEPPQAAQGRGSLIAALTLASASACAKRVIDIMTTRREDGPQVWINPFGLLIEPGQRVRWTTPTGLKDRFRCSPPSLQSASPETETARAHIRHLLEQGLDQLPDLFRIVFILHDVEALSIEETATQLLIKPEAVKTRLHRARACSMSP